MSASMPYKLDGNCVVRADTGAVVKCHPTHAEALAHLAALQINVHKDEWHAVGTIAKLDPARQLVFGWGSVITKADGTMVVDRQGDVVTKADDLEDAAYDYVQESRVGGSMHEEIGVGALVESMVFTPEKLDKLGLPQGSLPTAWWVGFKILDAAVWKRVEDGELVAFSIAGSGVRTELEVA